MYQTGATPPESADRHIASVAKSLALGGLEVPSKYLQTVPTITARLTANPAIRLATRRGANRDRLFDHLADADLHFFRALLGNANRVGLMELLHILAGCD